ncbi:MAG: hypothetical protein JXB38_08245 [Anaerolineales bacterium]|nr:hypothetical protein [Anaerolineales bacterium]
MKITHLLIFGIAVAALATCQSAQPTPTTALVITDTAAPSQSDPSETATAEIPMSASTMLGLVNNAPDGNRYVAGQGSFPRVTALDIPLAGTPVWIVGAPYQDGSLWVVTLEDGGIQAFTIINDQANAFELSPAQIPAGMPPVLQVSGDTAGLLTGPIDTISALTYPAWITKTGTLAYFTQQSELTTDGITLPVDALPDARLLTGGEGNLLLLSSPSQLYDHGVLGDAIEAESITLVATDPEPSIIRTIPIPDGKVFEGIAPIWTDITGDDEKEIIVTLSNAGQGAQLAVFSGSGELLAQSDPIGQGYRWRNQMAVAPFGPNGELELVDVLTPHINGVVEFFQLHGAKLEIVATVSGYTSHVIGTRNLDMAVAGDFNGDGQPEIVLPNQSLTTIAGIQRNIDGAAITWELALNSKLTTNLAAVNLDTDGLLLGIGLNNGTLRVWLP